MQIGDFDNLNVSPLTSCCAGSSHPLAVASFGCFKTLVKMPALMSSTVVDVLHSMVTWDRPKVILATLKWLRRETRG